MKPKNYEKIGLDTIGNGAACELFQEELKKVLSNIEDINTDAAKARTITLTITFKPDRERETAQVEIATKASLAPIQSAKTKLAIARDKGKLAAFEARPDAKAPDNVKEIGY